MGALQIDIDDDDDYDDSRAVVTKDIANRRRTLTHDDVL